MYMNEMSNRHTFIWESSLCRSAHQDFLSLMDMLFLLSSKMSWNLSTIPWSNAEANSHTTPRLPVDWKKGEKSDQLMMNTWKKSWSYKVKFCGLTSQLQQMILIKIQAFSFEMRAWWCILHQCKVQDDGCHLHYSLQHWFWWKQNFCWVAFDSTWWIVDRSLQSWRCNILSNLNNCTYSCYIAYKNILTNPNCDI